MKSWKLTGVIATLVIVLSIPLYYFTVETGRRSADEASLPQFAASFVGSEKCKDCHRKTYDKWQDSHHDHAMEMATEKTVLADFNHTVFSIHGITSRFFRKDGRFFVYTQGPGGKMAEFEITHTFGWYPLQQYLIPFPGGRLQCLPIAWDVKGKKWYHLYPQAPIDPNDWLYWTNAAQNWNGMCAECHSTDLKKNFDLPSASYKTTWSDIDVGCEACHGPGSRHVSWAEMPDMARPQVENYALGVKTSGIDSRQLVELCAPCHSRRAALGDYAHDQSDLLDSMLPSLLAENLYFADGQILEEVYVYGSFTQSKMYHRDVRCSDCHDVHSIRPVKTGNALCLQCHRAGEYDTRAHHFHKKKGESGEAIRSEDGAVLFDVGTGAECVQCHMPGRHYMGIDYRPDHSFRRPRPDLSSTLNTPNACNRCHVDKTATWSDETLTRWYGPGRRPHYGAVISAGRDRRPEAYQDLLRLAGDPLYPVVVRATALSLLGAYPGEDTQRVMGLALMDDEALIRRTAVENLQFPDQGQQERAMVPLLYDPVKAVRIEAARRLAENPKRQLRSDEQKVFQAVLDEYIAAMEFSADFASARHNLGNLYTALDRFEDAVDNYRAAFQIDGLFYPAKINLAMLYNRQGKNDEAERLLLEVVRAHPDLYEVQYSLGLLLAEKKQYRKAAEYMAQAARGLPGRARIHYNLGLLLQMLQKDTEAEESLQRAIELDPASLDFLYALADFYLKRNRREDARKIAERMIVLHPQSDVGKRFLDFIGKRP